MPDNYFQRDNAQGGVGLFVRAFFVFRLLKVTKVARLREESLSVEKKVTRVVGWNSPNDRVAVGSLPEDWFAVQKTREQAPFQHSSGR